MRFVSSFVLLSVLLSVCCQLRVPQKYKHVYKPTHAERLVWLETQLSKIQGKPTHPQTRLISPKRMYRYIDLEGAGKITFEHVQRQLPQNIWFQPQQEAVVAMPKAFQKVDVLVGEPRHPGVPILEHKRIMKEPAGDLVFEHHLGQLPTEIFWHPKPYELAELPYPRSGLLAAKNPDQ